MGNAARVAALVEALSSRIECHVVTWGAGVGFFRNAEVTALRDYAHAPFRVPVRFVLNSLHLRRLIRKFEPDLLVLDSDYHWPAYLWAGIPIAYVGQASDVLERAEAARYRPAAVMEWLNFLIREQADSWFQRRISTRILVPCFSGLGPVDAQVERIPLIVRAEYLRGQGRVAAGPPAVLLSGSGIGSSAFRALQRHGGFKFLNEVPSRPADLDACGIIFVQGGLSSISECIARGKFMVVVPIARHPEQYLNAMMVEKLGLGIMASAFELRDPALLLERACRAAEHAGRLRVDCTGAAAAAAILLQMLKVDGQLAGRERLHLVNSLDLAPGHPDGDLPGNPPATELETAGNRRNERVIPP